MEYALDAVKFGTNGKLTNMEFVINDRGKPDIAVFDFTSLKKAEHAARIVERKGHRLLMTLVGDSLIEVRFATLSTILFYFICTHQNLVLNSINLLLSPKTKMCGYHDYEHHYYRRHRNIIIVIIVLIIVIITVDIAVIIAIDIAVIIVLVVVTIIVIVIVIIVMLYQIDPTTPLSSPLSLSPLLLLLSSLS